MASIVTTSRAVTYQRKNDSAILVTASRPAITYVKGVQAPYTVRFYGNEGGVDFKPVITSVRVLWDSGAMSVWADETSVDNVRMSIDNTVATSSMIGFMFYPNATLDKCVVEVNFALRDGKNVPAAHIQITQYHNGTNGSRGPAIRGPRSWVDVCAHAGAGEKFYSGADGEEFLDVVCLVSGGQVNYYYCKVTHNVSDSNTNNRNPGTDSTRWGEFSNMDFIASKVLLAKKSKIDNLQVDDVELRDANNRVLFYLRKNDQGVCELMSSLGIFDNVKVNGDIRVNTLTYNHCTNSITEPLPLTNFYNYDYLNSQPSICVRPTGGCLIIPTGWSDYDIMLPEVTDGTVRQITVINQKLPSNGEHDVQRTVCLRSDTENVYLFPSLGSHDYLINTDPNKFVPLYHGAFNLYGYRAKIWLEGKNGNAGSAAIVTCWSIWQTDSPEHVPTIDTNNRLPVNPNALPIYNGLAPN